MRLAIEDNGTYDSLKEKNKAINDELATILSVLDKNGDKIENNFNIALNEDGSYSFTVEGKSLLRFLADVYGRTRTDDLKYNKKLGYNEAEASADQVIAYLCREKGFDLSEDVYARTDLYRILVIRYAMSQNSFQKYISTTIATDVSEKTVAYVSENAAVYISKKFESVLRKPIKFVLAMSEVKNSLTGEAEILKNAVSIISENSDNPILEKYGLSKTIVKTIAEFNTSYHA